MSVKRFDHKQGFCDEPGEFGETYDGDYVLHDDYTALEQRLRNAEAQRDEAKRSESECTAEFDKLLRMIAEGDADLTATKSRCAELERDAARYQKLRSIHWLDGDEALIVTRTRHAKLGAETFSTTRLDAVLAALAKLDAEKKV